MDSSFVENRNNSFYLAGSRVPLDFIVREFREGESPEAIRSDFPTLTLEQVYGAIAFYLGHQDEVDKAIVERDLEEDAYSAAHPAPPDIKQRFERMRRQVPARQS
ncbi:MAG TPA: DUF433 domain-containing protein [Terracidiphilus sp.]|jgi:hypothetical protein|nr:DUF433 domain-containing protein [Terracidiphilus sp.]